MQEIKIGLIGDQSPDVRAHQAIPMALSMAASDCRIISIWLSTAALQAGRISDLAQFHGFWCVPGSPYASMSGALAAITFARTKPKPFLGTCGGFQHALIEYARNVIGEVRADHAESNPAAEHPWISPLSCSLVGATQSIRLEPNSDAITIYQANETQQSFHCNYGLNPRFESALGQSSMKVIGRDQAEEVRLVQLEKHPFFFAALFQPELKALDGKLDPLIKNFVEACVRDASSANR